MESGVTISCNTIVWTGGISSNIIIKSLACDHDKSGRIMANNHLEILDFEDAW